jgi:hypothetical protein
MQPLTLLIALAGSALIGFLRPVPALCVYCAALFWYPANLTIKIGRVDFPAARILILVFLLKIVFRTGLVRRLKWDRLDTFVLLAFVGRSLALVTNAGFSRVLETEGGAFFDRILPYLAVRLVVSSRSDVLAFFKGIFLTAAPLALVGAYESATGNNPMGFLQVYDAWGETSLRVLSRHGFYRASVSFLGNYIPFGLLFAALAPLSLGLLDQKVWPRPVVLVCCGVMILGGLSSMSSAPIFAMSVAFAMVASFRFRHAWRLALTFGVICAVFLEFYSSRHFYEVPTRFAFSTATAYYRIGLIREALGGGMTGHWLAGYGYVGVGVGADNTNFHWEHQDLVNMYVGILATSGLLGLAPYLVLNYLYYKRLYQAAKRGRDRDDWWLVWCVAATLVGWNTAMMTVAPLGQIRTFLYILIGVCCALPRAVARPAAAPAPVRWAAPHTSQAGRADQLSPGGSRP